MPRRLAVVTIIIVLTLGLTALGVFAFRNFRGAGPAFQPAPENIVELLENTNTQPTNTQGTNTAPTENGNVSTQVSHNATGFPLTLPAGFSINVFAKLLVGARDIAQDAEGNLWVSQLSQGKVTKLTLEAGKLKETTAPFQKLNNPHGLVFDPDEANILYIAEERRITKARLNSDAPLEKLVDLPEGNNHNRRTLAIGPDKRLYVSIGSSCNVCNESNQQNATVYSLNRDGSDFKVFATGLRNAAFLAFRPTDGKLWATENGRDLLGDNLPPDEVNILEAGKFYGWPFCYGKNVADTNFNRNAATRCATAVPSHINLQAHSAPLGLAFIPDTESWPADMRGDLLVAYHGSWNRTQPTGYKVVRIDINADGSAGETHDFISGWLTADGALGRPVDVLPTADGRLYITDDKAGVVYEVTTSLFSPR